MGREGDGEKTAESEESIADERWYTISNIGYTIFMMEDRDDYTPLPLLPFLPFDRFSRLTWASLLRVAKLFVS